MRSLFWNSQPATDLPLRHQSFPKWSSSSKREVHPPAGFLIFIKKCIQRWFASFICHSSSIHSFDQNFPQPLIQGFLPFLLLTHLSSLLSQVFWLWEGHSVESLYVPQQWWPHVIACSSHLGPRESTGHWECSLLGRARGAVREGTRVETLGCSQQTSQSQAGSQPLTDVRPQQLLYHDFSLSILLVYF